MRRFSGLLQSTPRSQDASSTLASRMHEARGTRGMRHLRSGVVGRVRPPYPAAAGRSTRPAPRVSPRDHRRRRDREHAGARAVRPETAGQHDARRALEAPGSGSGIARAAEADVVVAGDAALTGPVGAELRTSSCCSRLMSPTFEVGICNGRQCAAFARAISHQRKFVVWSMISVRCATYGTCPAPVHDVRNESRPAAVAWLKVATAHEYGTITSAVPWKSRLGASPESYAPYAMCAPESDTAAPTAAVGSSPELNPTLSAVIAPAEEPPIAMRLTSMP